MEWDDILSGGATSAIGAGMGLLLEGHNDQRQYEQQKRLQQLQIQGQMQMADYQQANALKMWEATGPQGQMQQLSKAGLNPGLMYGKGGPGGSTAGAGQGGGISGGTAQQNPGEMMGMMQNRMQLEMMEAQKRNIDADTANKQAENPNIPKTGENISADTSLKNQNIQNAKAQQALTEVQTEIAKQQAEYNPEILRQTIEKQAEEIVQLWNANAISNGTRDSIISKMKTDAANAIIQGEAMQVGIKLTQEQIKKINADINQNQENIDINKFRAEIEANNPDASKIVGNMLNSIKTRIQEIGHLDKNYVRPNRVNKQ